MADQSTAFLQQPQFLDPEQQQQLNEIARKQRMAQLLTQTGMTPVQGQMVGNRYVAPAWSQYANQLFSAYAGRKTAEEAESMQTKLAQALKGQQASEIAKFNDLLQTNPNEAYVIGALTSATGSGDSFRADIASVMATRLVNYSLVFADKNSVPDTMIKRLVKLTTDCDAFTNDLRYYMVKEVVNGNKVKFAAMMRDNAVVKMAVK